MQQIEFLDKFITIFNIKGIDDYDTKIYSSQYSTNVIGSILQRINDNMPQIKSLFQASQLQLSRTNYQVENMTVAFGLLKNLLRQANIPYDIYKSNSRTYLQLKPLNNELREYLENKMESICTSDCNSFQLTQTSPIIDLEKYMTDNPPTLLDIECDEKSQYLTYLKYMSDHKLSAIKYNTKKVEYVSTIELIHTTNQYCIITKSVHGDFIYNPSARLIINNRVYANIDLHIINNYRNIEYTNVANKYFPNFPSATQFLILIKHVGIDDLIIDALKNTKIKIEITYDTIIGHLNIRGYQFKIGETDPIFGPNKLNTTLFDKVDNRTFITRSNNITWGEYGNMYDITVKSLDSIEVAILELDGQIIDCVKTKPGQKEITFDYWTVYNFIPLAFSPKRLDFKFINTNNNKPTLFYVSYKILKLDMNMIENFKINDFGNDIPGDYKFVDAKGNVHYNQNGDTPYNNIPNIYDLAKKPIQKILSEIAHNT